MTSYADAPTKANQLMWPLNLNGERRLELEIRNNSGATRVYKVGFFIIDASLLQRRWDVVPGLPTGGNNPGASFLARAPRQSFQRLELYTDGTPGSLLGQDFTGPARWRTGVQLFPDFDEPCFTVRLSSTQPLDTTAGGHRNVGALQARRAKDARSSGAAASAAVASHRESCSRCETTARSQREPRSSSSPLPHAELMRSHPRPLVQPIGRRSA